MKTKTLVIALLFVSLAQAKEPKVHQNGTLLQMDSAECGVDENSGKSVVGELVGTDSAHKRTHALLCQEYLLQSETVIYRKRPKRAVLTGMVFGQVSIKKSSGHIRRYEDRSQ